jgi:hypothetical protein
MLEHMIILMLWMKRVLLLVIGLIRGMEVIIVSDDVLDAWMDEQYEEYWADEDERWRDEQLRDEWLWERADALYDMMQDDPDFMSNWFDYVDEEVE